MPTVDPIALQHSKKLIQFISQDIKKAGGSISFDRFMDLALYAPGLGYYSAGQHKLGRSGDFITAPELTPLFAKCIARQWLQIATDIPESSILELGAGSGILAKDLLLELAILDVLPKQYFILEVSADLRERQRELLTKEIPHLLDRVVWLESLPLHPINGMIFANEVMDALPVRLFTKNQQGIFERCVIFEENRFHWILKPVADELEHELRQFVPIDELPLHYNFEANVMISAWLNSLCAQLNKGIILLFDYGYTRAEYYHPDRSMGTLLCYYQHQCSDTPLERVGLQDITAHVDFTRVIESINLDVYSLAGFATQADFLLGCGLLSLVDLIEDPLRQYQQAHILKTLLMPGEMGELIKVMALAKEYEKPLIGFSLNDRSITL